MNSPLETDHNILPWLGRSMKLAGYYMADSFKANSIELTRPQLVMLIILMKNNDQPQPQNSLAFLTNRDKASLARLVDTMEKKNLVERLADENDKRVKLVKLTENGKKTLFQAFPVVEKVNKTIQNNIPQDELKIAIEVLKKIVTNIKSVEDTSTLEK